MSTKQTRKTASKKAPALREQDPWLERERERYEFPLPSREYILKLLEDEGAPLPPERLARMLDIAAEEHEAFTRRIAAMERQGQLMINRRGDLCVAKKLNLIPGRVDGHPDGFGFLVPDDGSPDLFLSPKEMQQVLHGDRAMVRESGVDRRGRPEGKIVEVLERKNRFVVGRLYSEHGVKFVVAENKRISQDILVSPTEDGKANPGQVVNVEIVTQPSSHAQPVGRVVEVLGGYADPGMEIEIALRKHELPHVFPEAVEKLATKLPDEVRRADGKGHEDLRDLPLVTIDGEDARDFDDAVYCEKKGRGWRLVVAIADVSHYVRPGDALDLEAFERGNSVYFPRRVIPMLPEKLSNGLCSLNAEVDRLCMACDMEVSANGDIGAYRFFPAVMHSKARLTYNQVWDWLSGQADPGGRAPLMPYLNNLFKLYKSLKTAREKRGAIDFETIETKLEFDDQDKIAAIRPLQRNDAHRIIEECMLAANVCASDFLAQREHPALYRIHEGPTPEKLEALRGFLAEFGLVLAGGDEPQARDYAKLLDKVKTRPDVQLIQTVMLRSLRQAIYSPDNVGHFGLAYEHYTHFTSPIRRYPDLLVHRAIKAALEGGKYVPGQWNSIGMHCSMTERRADEATRDVVAWLKTYYMQDRIGFAYDGTVSAVTSFGIFVALDEVYVEGLVHISELGPDYFQFDPARHQLLGERTGQRFRLGDRLRVKVVRADIETSKIDFVLAPDEAPAAEKKGRKRR